MTTPPVPTPSAVPTGGVHLAVEGADANNLPSLLGLVSPSFAISDPASVFTFTPAADQMSADIVPNPGVTGQATVTFTVGSTNADGSAGTTLTATYLAEVVAGNAVSVTLVATDIVPAGG